MIWQKCSESENNIEGGLKKNLASDISNESCPPFLSFDLIVQIMLIGSLWLYKSILTHFPRWQMTGGTEADLVSYVLSLSKLERSPGGVLSWEQI